MRPARPRDVIIARAVSVGGCSLGHSSSNSALAQTARSSGEARVGATMTCSAIGVVLGPALAGVLAQCAGLGAPFWVAGDDRRWTGHRAAYHHAARGRARLPGPHAARSATRYATCGRGCGGWPCPRTTGLSLRFHARGRDFDEHAACSAGTSRSGETISTSPCAVSTARARAMQMTGRTPAG